jgi:SAM-dependent methyltransferase
LFELYYCPSCEAVSQTQEKIKDRIDQFYPDGYWWDDSSALSCLERFYRESVVRFDQVKFLKSVCPDPNGTRLLDIGCGNSMFLRLAREVGFDAFGLDTSVRATVLAAKELPDRVFHGTEEMLIKAGESFDLLVLLHVLEHVPDPFQYLKRIRGLLRSPGGIIVQVPNVCSYQARLFGSRWYGLDCPRHICNFSQYSLLHLLGRCGFRIERVRHYSLRDNAAAVISSLLPGLDPISQRIRNAGRRERVLQTRMGFSELLYFVLVISAQPLAWAESKLGRGGTVTVHATT